MVISYNRNTSTYRVTALGRLTKTKVTTSGDIVPKWIDTTYASLRDKQISEALQPALQPALQLTVGIDVKLSPDGYNGRNTITVLTMYTGRRCLVFQISKCNSIPPPLYGFLHDGQIRFVGLNIDRTKEWLQHDYNLELENVENIAETVAERKHLEVVPTTLKDLYRAVYEKELVKPEVAGSNWEDDPLSLEQIECATIDAFVLYKIGKKFS